MLRFLAALLLAAIAPPAIASFTPSLTPAAHTEASAAVCVAEVVRMRSSEEPATRQIFTTVTLRVEEALKGTFPALINLKQFGGTVGNRAQFQSDTPNLKTGERRLFFLGRREDGSLYCLNGPSSAQLVDRDTGDAGAGNYGPFFNQVIVQIRNAASTGEDVTDQVGSALTPHGIGGFLDSAGSGPTHSSDYGYERAASRYDHRPGKHSAQQCPERLVRSLFPVLCH